MDVMKLQHEEQARVHAADRLAMAEAKAVADKVNLLVDHSFTHRFATGVCI